MNSLSSKQTLLTGFVLLAMLIGTAQAGMPASVQQAADRILSLLDDDPSAPFIVVHIPAQELFYFKDGTLSARYPVSTAAKGIGNQSGSYQTPPGLHKVAEKFGDDAPRGMIFRGRVATGQIAEILTEPVKSDHDVITSRILWLDGLQEGVNRGPGIDSKSRYIYIHGTDEEGLIGQPASDGCVRMTNDDVIRLFDKVPLGTYVDIVVE